MNTLIISIYKHTLTSLSAVLSPVLPAKSASALTPSLTMARAAVFSIVVAIALLIVLAIKPGSPGREVC